MGLAADGIKEILNSTEPEASAVIFTTARPRKGTARLFSYAAAAAAGARAAVILATAGLARASSSAGARRRTRRPAVPPLAAAPRPDLRSRQGPNTYARAQGGTWKGRARRKLEAKKAAERRGGEEDGDKRGPSPPQALPP